MTNAMTNGEVAAPMTTKEPRWLPDGVAEAEAFIAEYELAGIGNPEMVEYCRRVVEAKGTKAVPFTGSPPVGKRRPKTEK